MVWFFGHESEAKQIQNISSMQAKMQTEYKRQHDHDEKVHEQDKALLQQKQRELTQVGLEKNAWKDRAEQLEHANSLLKAHSRRRSSLNSAEQAKREKQVKRERGSERSG